MIRTLKVLSLLLTYPTREIAEAAPSFAAALDGERLLPEARRAPLRRLAAQIAGRDLYDLEERYVLLFDRTRSLSLHLFEHVHGESRDRGQAMVELKELYAANGLEMPGNELPDYLPLFLEFLSTRPFDEARGYLADVAHIVSALGERPAAAQEHLRRGLPGPRGACAGARGAKRRGGAARAPGRSSGRPRGARPGVGRSAGDLRRAAGARRVGFLRSGPGGRADPCRPAGRRPEPGRPGGPARLLEGPRSLRMSQVCKAVS